MLTRLYQWMLAKAAHRHADRWLAVISFMESSFFPIPPDVLLAPMCLSQPKRAFYYAFVCTAASVLGALLGYAIGYFLFDTIGQAILDFYGLGDKFSAFSDNFNEQGWLIVFLAGFTPLPFKVITIAAGVTAMPLYVLIGASIVSRGARFFLEAALLWKFGEPMKRLIDRHFGLITTIGGILLVGGFIALRYLGGSHEAEKPASRPNGRNLADTAMMAAIHRHPLLLALVLGGLAATGFAPLGLWPVTLLCVAGLMWLAENLPTSVRVERSRDTVARLQRLSTSLEANGWG